MAQCSAQDEANKFKNLWLLRVQSLTEEASKPPHYCLMAKKLSIPEQ
jgi:hypothetical protein